MTHAELCSGYGATSLALGSAPAWHAEIDKHAAKVFAAHWPDAPNLGDLTRIDWTTVEPVDLLTAGFPCQPISTAGKRKVTNDDRWLWPYILTAVRVLRPRHVFLENVPPLLRPWRDGGGWQPAPIEGITGDLAAIGYMGSWVSVRAADVGAPHLRDRVFILAADSDREQRRRQHAGEPRQVGVRSDPSRTGQPPVAITDGKRAGGGPVAIPRTTEPTRRPDLNVHSVVDAPSRASAWWYATKERRRFAPCIERWTTIQGPAPHPVTADGRLNPQFSEWMMGIPAGHITDVGIPTTAKHRTIGNGQVPLQVQAAMVELGLIDDQISRHTHTHTQARSSEPRRQRPKPSRQHVLPARIDPLLPTPRTSDSTGSGEHGDGGNDLRTTIANLT